MKHLKTELLIIGGGINGIATARMAADNGIDCILIEASDICSGTSNASSKLVHGGLRYLEHYDFGLVHEAAIERKRLLENAPQFVKEQRFLFPNCEQNSHGRFMTKMGISLYEILAGKYSLRNHQWVDPEDLAEREPQFLPKDFIGAYEYSDCNMDDAALAVSAALDAQLLGAHIHTYQSAQSLEFEGNLWNCQTQSKTLSDDALRIQANKVLLTLGPWTDKLLKQWGISYPQMLQLSQGAHLYVEKLPIETSFILPVPNTQRYFFVLPWKEGHLIGTTETPITNDSQFPPSIEPQEMGELMYLMSVYFPHLTPKVICTIAGIRPLAIENPHAPHLDNTSSIKTSRQHLFHEVSGNQESPLIAGVGGKWTTQRLFAEEGLSRLGYEIRRKQEERPYPNLSEAPLEDLEEEIFHACKNLFCKTPLDFIRNRSSLYFTEHAGQELWPIILDAFKKFYPKENPQQWLDDYLNYLKNNQHRAFKKFPHNHQGKL